MSIGTKVTLELSRTGFGKLWLDGVDTMASGVDMVCRPGNANEVTVHLNAPLVVARVQAQVTLRSDYGAEEGEWLKRRNAERDAQLLRYLQVRGVVPFAAEAP